MAVLRFLIVIPFGFVLSCFAAAFALLWPFLDTAGAATGDPLFWLQAILGFVAQSAQVGSTAVVPWALFMVLTESLGWRSVLLHMAAGLAGAFAVIRTAYVGALPHASVQTAMMVAGLTFALVYWIFAGRNAGRWRQRKTGPAETVESAPKA
ncbi:hypothetical protein Sa4125_42220 [Aureimonas sp. SA4125]|uniref:hypothetical protein n=1 Tax=Aureimonas sp. SA4125 TaxID=2826993 RepID=UPI001CC73CDC|nr:hypothetical protein [Aureimonas sp. SA4125]BDA86680.1 hypothetical protein Sa4125_42220 [Aureimonas sp. SA4125]